MHFSLGELDVADKVGIGYLFCLWGWCVLEAKNMVLVPSMYLEGRRYLPPPCAKRKHSFALEISQVAFSGPDREFGGRIWYLWWR